MELLEIISLNWPAAICLLAGFILVTIELFTPGFGVPGISGLALLLIGLVSGYYLPTKLGLPGNPDFYAVGLGLLLAAGAFLALRLTEKKRKSSGKYAPKVVHVERLCEKAQQNG